MLLVFMEEPMPLRPDFIAQVAETEGKNRPAIAALLRRVVEFAREHPDRPAVMLGLIRERRAFVEREWGDFQRWCAKAGPTDRTPARFDGLTAWTFEAAFGALGAIENHAREAMTAEAA